MLFRSGLHYWQGEEWSISNEQARKFFYKQLLTGDTTDNIPGCKGIGPKRADDILESASSDLECWQATVRQFERVTRDETEAKAQALLMGNLVRILRYGDYDWANHQVIPWTPPMPDQLLPSA